VKKIAAVAALEISEKAVVLPAALLLGGLPFLIAAVRGRSGAEDVRNLSAAFLALLAGGALAVTLGFWSTAGDAASRRTAFFLAHPLSPFELWAGKAAGSLSIVFGAVALALLPAALAGARLRETAIPPMGRPAGVIVPDRLPPAGMIAVTGVALVAIFLLSQAAGVATLARSPWLLADLVFCGAAVAIAFSLARTLVAARAETALVAGGAALLAGLLVALAIGSHEAVRRGRIDLRRAARAQSIAFWSVTAALLALSALGAAWVLGATPADIRTVFWIIPAARGDWITVTGSTRWRGGYKPTFFENVQTGDFLRVRPFFDSRSPIIAGDGRRAAWTSAVPGLGEPTLTPHTAALDARHPDRVAWETKDLHTDPLLIFSRDSTRLAVIVADRITVWDTSAGAMLVSARSSSPLWEQARGFTCATFAGPEVLRVYSVRLAPDSPRKSIIDIQELDVARRRLLRTGTAGPFARTFPILTDAARERLLVRDGPERVTLLDARTGAIIRTISGAAAISRSADFLSDGRIALFESPGGQGRVVVLSRNGDRQKEIPIGPAERAYILGERPAGFLMIVAGSRDDLIQYAGRVLVVDLARGTVVPWGDHLSPAAPYARFMVGDPGDIPAPDSLATRLFFTRERALVQLVAPFRLRRVLPAQ
jgi:hypothetical protein